MSFMGYRGDSQNPDESMEPESTLLWICESIWNQLDGIGKGKSGQRDKPCTKPKVTKLKEPAYQQWLLQKQNLGITNWQKIQRVLFCMLNNQEIPTSSPLYLVKGFLRVTLLFKSNSEMRLFGCCNGSHTAEPKIVVCKQVLKWHINQCWKTTFEIPLGSVVMNNRFGHALHHIYENLGKGTMNDLLWMELIEKISVMSLCESCFPCIYMFVCWNKVEKQKLFFWKIVVENQLVLAGGCENKTSCSTILYHFLLLKVFHTKLDNCFVLDFTMTFWCKSLENGYLRYMGGGEDLNVERFFALEKLRKNDFLCVKIPKVTPKILNFPSICDSSVRRERGLMRDHGIIFEKCPMWFLQKDSFITNHLQRACCQFRAYIVGVDYAAFVINTKRIILICCIFTSVFIIILYHNKSINKGFFSIVLLKSYYRNFVKEIRNHKFIFVHLNIGLEYTIHYASTENCPDLSLILYGVLIGMAVCHQPEALHIFCKWTALLGQFTQPAYQRKMGKNYFLSFNFFQEIQWGLVKMYTQVL
ncbi:hypothetical protein VP01_339g1 [Puccinia sorghi]|uniref:Uncharacterized protein n=1 Tax=Puccinia sorghi TaxID=27349 RepID=A0A0L6UWP8_9BASI|nr:hypothetical protein VP01_339g1 [Puccinia sorghi]